MSDNRRETLKDLCVPPPNGRLMERYNRYKAVLVTLAIRIVVVASVDDKVEEAIVNCGAAGNIWLIDDGDAIDGAVDDSLVEDGVRDDGLVDGCIIDGGTINSRPFDDDVKVVDCYLVAGFFIDGTLEVYTLVGEMGVSMAVVDDVVDDDRQVHRTVAG
ncbi:hypothetical protein NDU88_008696 [Pleurodeles waltl]|uniref:Uncharacterized protein n=1 Tax=Pleurodeles waltl TaxID=8319 RepID=A0AAV7NWV3_PLEWA|nr:hypothetical protein NDU88_008696 [Pleurodeles waltl]